MCGVNDSPMTVGRTFPTKLSLIHQLLASNFKRDTRRDLYRRKSAVYAMARKITDGAIISVFLLSLMCAFWYASADCFESAIIYLEQVVESVFSINQISITGSLRGPAIRSSCLYESKRTLGVVSALHRIRCIKRSSNHQYRAMYLGQQQSECTK